MFQFEQNGGSTEKLHEVLTSGDYATRRQGRRMLNIILAGAG